MTNASIRCSESVLILQYIVDILAVNKTCCHIIDGSEPVKNFNRGCLLKSDNIQSL